MAVRSSPGERVFLVVNAIVLSMLAISALLPVVNIVAVSFSRASAVDRNLVRFLPVDFTLASWANVLQRSDLWRSFGVTVFITVVGTFLSLLLTSLSAYPLSKREFVIGRYVMIGIVITMIFKAPMIPYFLTVRAVGLYDSVWALIIPSVISAFNLVIMRTFFQQIPDELEEAAEMEGAQEFHILFRIVIPLSKPALATLGLFYGVMYWNMFQHALLFIADYDLFPLQLKLRSYVSGAEPLATEYVSLEDRLYNTRTVLAAAIIFAIIPVVLIYPFLQRYFVKGAMIGSLKG